MAMIAVTLVDTHYPVGRVMTTGALRLAADQEVMGGKSGLEAVLMRMTGCTVGSRVVIGIASCVFPVVGLGVAYLADAGGRSVYDISKSALGVKELNLPFAAAWGCDSLADVLTIEKTKGVGLRTSRGLGTGRGVDVPCGKDAFDDDLSGGGGDHREGIEGLRRIVHQDEAPAWGAGALVTPCACRPEAQEGVVRLTGIGDSALAGGRGVNRNGADFAGH